MRLAAALLMVFLTTGLAAADTIRIATFNASLNRKGPGLLIRDLEKGKDRQIKAVQEIIAAVKPDILLINEFDHDRDGIALKLFQAQLNAQGLDFPYAFAGPSNTGEPSGIDLNGDGKSAGPADAYGYGIFRGQYGMALLSRFPIDTAKIRSFRLLKWRDLPGATLPIAKDGTPFPSEQAHSAMRLSSKAHWDVPITLLGNKQFHILASHPTPPVFDGPEDHNGLRNADEVLFWKTYIDGAAIADDTGLTAAFTGSYFAIAGDLNVDPYDGQGRQAAIKALLTHPRLQNPEPSSKGAAEAAKLQAGANQTHQGDPALDTADWRDDRGPGNLRVDYVLPSSNLQVVASGVFWPERGDQLVRLIGTGKPLSSDHRLVWVDVRF